MEALTAEQVRKRREQTDDDLDYTTDLEDDAPIIPLKRTEYKGVTVENFEPYANYLLVREETPEDVTPSGLILASKLSNATTLCTVLAVGPGIVNFNIKEHTVVPCETKVGDKVIAPTNLINKIKLPNREEISVVLETNVFGRFPGSE